MTLSLWSITRRRWAVDRVVESVCGKLCVLVWEWRSVEWADFTARLCRTEESHCEEERTPFLRLCNGELSEVSVFFGFRINDLVLISVTYSCRDVDKETIRGTDDGARRKRKALENLSDTPYRISRADIEEVSCGQSSPRCASTQTAGVHYRRRSVWWYTPAYAYIY